MILNLSDFIVRDFVKRFSFRDVLSNQSIDIFNVRFVRRAIRFSKEYRDLERPLYRLEVCELSPVISCDREYLSSAL